MDDGEAVETEQVIGGSEVEFFAENRQPPTGTTPMHARALAIVAGGES